MGIFTFTVGVERSIEITPVGEESLLAEATRIQVLEQVTTHQTSKARR
jgi:hypothetical protein